MPKLISKNPYTLEVNATYETISEQELIEKIELAHTAYLSWRDVPSLEKKRLFLTLADALERDIDNCARLETIEMGMLYKNAKAWLQKTANLIRWFANNFESVFTPRTYETEWLQVLEMYDPIGVIYGIAPWNFPFNQLLRAAVPNILAGNTQVYKHASNVPMVAERIERLFHEAGFPKWVYTNLFVPSSMSEAIIAHPYIRGVNLTGSETAWSAVGALAGKYLKRSVLELGGNDAFVVLPGTDIEKVVTLAVAGRTRNGGQACNASKRFLVPDVMYEEFLEKYKNAFESLVLWDPMDEKTDLQPLVNEKSLDDMDAQVARAIATGARLIKGGKRIEWSGYFYAPTILADVTPAVSSYNEEIFGPVASVMSYSTIDEAVTLANGTDFGLSAVVVWDDISLAQEIGKKLDGGMIFINMTAGSRASLPFGGTKKSWYGKENWVDGLLAFTNKKVIVSES